MPQRFLSRPSRLAWPVLAAGTVLVTAVAGPAPADAAAHPARAVATAGWQIYKTFPASTNLYTLTALSGGTAWVGGETPGQEPLLYHRVAGKWHRTVLPGSFGTFVNSISATSTTNVWAALSNTPAVEHLTTAGWVAHTFAIGTGEILLAGVLSVSPNDTFVFAYDEATKRAYAYHYNGSRWSRKPMPDGGANANSSSGIISGTSYSNVWTLGYSGNKAASLRFNGKRWQVFAFPANLAPAGSTVYPRQILAESPKNVWAVLYTTHPDVDGAVVGPVVLLHWNGYKWRKVGGKLPQASLTGPIASDGSGGLWLAAINTAYTKPMMLHYSRGKWSSHRLPTDLGDVLTMTELSLVPGTRTVLGSAIVGEGGFGTSAGTAVVKYAS